jgi:serine/threonine protein kinase
MGNWCCPQRMVPKDSLISKFPIELEMYKLLGSIGSGNFGDLQLVRHRQTWQLYAMKVISKSKCNHYAEEIQIHSSLRHPNIIQFCDLVEDSTHVYVFLEYAEQGDLFNLCLGRSPKVRLTEEQVSSVVREIIEALIYLHDKNVFHGDLKPENILVTRDGHVKLGDFGLACRQAQSTSIRGTIDFIAPEICLKNLFESYDKRVDLWMLGILTCELLSTYCPFKCYADTIEKHIDRFSNCTDPNDLFIDLKTYMSACAYDFVCGLLQMNPIDRRLLEDCLLHPFISRQSVAVDHNKSPQK